MVALVKKVINRQKPFEAVYYDGTSDSRRDIVEWSEGSLRDHKGKLYTRFPYIVRLTNDDPCWILRCNGSSYYSISDDIFYKLYMEV